MTPPGRAYRLTALASVLALTFAGQPATAARDPHLRPDIASDEGGMWAEMDKAELAAKTSGELDKDPALTDYVRRVACKVADGYCDDIRVYVFDRPFFQATAAPNGYVEVWSGLLLRAQDEAQLAFVLGHEISHFTENHSVIAFRAQKARMNTAMVLSFAIGAVGMAGAYSASTVQAANNIANATNNLINAVYLAAVAAYFEFSRDNETDADRIGADRAIRAGYDPQAGPAMWRTLIAETSKSDFPRVRQAETRASIFNSHPLSTDRVKALEALAMAAPASPPDPDSAKRYRAAIRPHLDAWLRDDLRRRDFGETLYILDRLMADGEDLGLLNYYRGEAFRLRRGASDPASARAAYEAALTFPDAPAAAWRELGDTAKSAGDLAAAKAAYAGYLNHAPQAQDRWLVEASLKTIP